jgi:two-component system, LytTR family, response regulator
MEKYLSALIVDDEQKAVDLMTRLLEDSGQFSRLFSAFDTDAALSQIVRFKPDLVFLDIKMPGKNGFQFLKELQQIDFIGEIVFVTAYDEFALQAFRNHAFGYLLKPVDRHELKNLLFEYARRNGIKDHLVRLARLLEDYEKVKQKIRVNTRAGHIFIDPQEILYCVAEGNYTNVHLGEKVHVCSMQLGDFEGLLPGSGFKRPGRSLIINLELLSSVNRKSSTLTFEKGSKEFSIMVKKSEIRNL